MCWNHPVLEMLICRHCLDYSFLRLMDKTLNKMLIVTLVPDNMLKCLIEILKTYIRVKLLQGNIHFTFVRQAYDNIIILSTKHT